MSGVVIYPYAMMKKTESMLNELEGMEPNVLSAKRALNGVSMNKLFLQGVAWDSVSMYIENVQKPLISTYSLWLTEQRNATVIYRNAAGRLPKVYSLDQDQLRDQLIFYEKRLDHELDKDEPNMSRVRRYNQMIYQINLKLEAIDDFLSETAGAYQEALAVQGILKQADAELSGVEYNPMLHKVDYSSVTASWLFEMKGLAQKELLVVKEQEENHVPLSLEEPLELILGEDGNTYLEKLLTKEEITDEEYLMVAMALIMAGDDKLVETAIKSCYQYSEVKELSVGGLSTVNVLFEKTERLGILEKNINIVLNLYIRSAAAATPEEVTKMRKVLQDAMQYNQLFLATESMDRTLVTSSFSNNFDTSGIVKVKGDPLIALIRDEKNKLNMSWYKYTAGNSGADFNTLKESKLIISHPVIGSVAQLRSGDEGERYIRSNLPLESGVDNLETNIGQAIIDYSIGAIPVKGAGIISSVWAVVRGQAEVNSETVAFNIGMDIKEIGHTLDLFNLYYVSSVKEEHGKETEHNFSIYPSFGDEDSFIESTQECIDNFNRNFGDGGKLKDLGKDIGTDAALTIEELQDDFPKVMEMVRKWGDVCDDKSWVMQKATKSFR